MKSDAVVLQARQFQRHTTRYKARLQVHPDHAAQFRLSLPDVQNDLSVVDVSSGGLGLASGFYLPKNLRLTLRVSSADDEDASRGHAATVAVIVKHCALVDHQPSYRVGTQFLNPSGRDEQTLVEAAATEQQSTGQPMAGGVRAG